MQLTRVFEILFPRCVARVSLIGFLINKILYRAFQQRHTKRDQYGLLAISVDNINFYSDVLQYLSDDYLVQ